MSKLQLDERDLAQNTGGEPAQWVTTEQDGSPTHSKGLDGRCARINIRQGFDVLVYDAIAEQSGTFQASSTPGLAMNIMLTGSGVGNVFVDQGEQITIPHQSETTYLSLSKSAISGDSTVTKGDKLQCIDFRCSFAFLKQLNQYSALESLNNKHSLHYASNEAIWIGLSKTSRHTKQNALYILEEAFNPSREDIQFESRVLNILSETLNLFVCNDKKDSPNKGESRKLTMAHELMLNQLSHPWTIANLAREIGLNEKKLKSGFRLKYGYSIGQYLQNIRLEKAKSMLELNGTSVTEVSLSVGYANPSHFAYLFKREFGQSPSKFR